MHLLSSNDVTYRLVEVPIYTCIYHHSGASQNVDIAMQYLEIFTTSRYMYDRNMKLLIQLFK